MAYAGDMDEGNLQGSVTPEGRVPLAHGGGLSGAARRFPDAPRPWVDLSTGINPIAYPIGTLPPEVWSRLPDPEALVVLEAAAAAAYDASDRVTVVAAPGTQALIQLCPTLFPARRVAVLGFGYQEHPATWAASGADVRIVDRREALLDADVAVVVNPNNPDGRTVARVDLLRVAKDLAMRGGMLIVDEAFADVADPGLSLVPVLPPNAVVLRSFGKIYRARGPAARLRGL